MKTDCRARLWQPIDSLEQAFIVFSLLLYDWSMNKNQRLKPCFLEHLRDFNGSETARTVSDSHTTAQRKKLTAKSEIKVCTGAANYLRKKGLKHHGDRNKQKRQHRAPNRKNSGAARIGALGFIKKGLNLFSPKSIAARCFGTFFTGVTT